jgi:hypothetical protein
MEKLLPPHTAHARSTLIRFAFLAFFSVTPKRSLRLVDEPLRLFNAASERSLDFFDF